MSVADTMAELGAAATNFANSCHINGDLLPLEIMSIAIARKPEQVDDRGSAGARNVVKGTTVEGGLLRTTAEGRVDRLDRESRCETILIVEDAEPIRQMIEAMLAQSGYQCLVAPDGSAALALLDARPEGVDLVLTDLLMPQMTGMELADHLGRRHPEMPIVFMSGYAEDPLVASIGHTRTNFLAKPFTARELLEKVRCALQGSWHEGSAELRSGSGAS
jgi:CheY-like chemotaxis protein